MRDHLLNWHEKFQPLAPALKTPRIEVEEKAPLSDFETRSYDHPSCTGGNAPSLSPQSLVPSPAARRALRVGDMVRVYGTHTGTVRQVTGPVVRIAMDGGSYATDENGLAPFYADSRLLELIPSQPSDTQQWVEWTADAPRPVPFGALVEIRRPSGELWSGEATCNDWPAKTIAAYRVVQ